MTENKMSVEDDGFTVLPLFDAQYNLTFGIYIVPVFDPSLD